MLVLNPQSVQLLGATVERVTRVAVSRTPERSLLEWGNTGPYPTFADVPEQRVEIELVADLERGSLDGPEPGDEGTLEFYTAPTAGHGGRRKVETTVVVTAVRDHVEPGGRALGRIWLFAFSSCGWVVPMWVGVGVVGFSAHYLFFPGLIQPCCLAVCIYRSLCLCVFCWCLLLLWWRPP
ncbi:MAG: hypothetical protein ACIAS6_02880, partial [Phycisphaerales bacterium JB060]